MRRFDSREVDEEFDDDYNLQEETEVDNEEDTNEYTDNPTEEDNEYSIGTALLWGND